MIYFLQQKSSGLIKIGCTIQLNRRVYDLTMDAGELELLGLMDGNLKDEHALHRVFSHLNVRDVKGRFRTYMGDEWFNPGDDLLEYIKANTSLNFPLPFRGEISARPFPPADLAKAALHFEIYHRFAARHDRTTFTVKTNFVPLLRRKLSLTNDDPLPKASEIAALIPGVHDYSIRGLISGSFGYSMKPSAVIVKRVIDWLGCTIDDLLPSTGEQSA